MKRKYDVVATIGEYEENGQKKYRTQKIGVVLENDKGHLDLKLESIPVGQYWSGYAKLFEPRIDEKGFQEAKQVVQEDQEIPF